MNETKYLHGIKHYYILSSNILSIDKLRNMWIQIRYSILCYMFKNCLLILYKQAGNEMYKMQFKEGRKGFILQKEFTVYSANSCNVVLCLRSLSLSILYGNWCPSGYGYYATSTDRDNSNDYPLYFYAVCMEKTVRQNEI